MSFVSVTTPESGIVRDGLLYWINPSLASSYSGSGTTIYDLSGNDHDSSLQSGAGFSADNGGVFSTNGSSSWIKLETDFLGATELNADAHFTISMWFRTVEGSSGMLLSQTNNATIGLGTSWVPAIYVGTDGKLRVSCFWGSATTNQTTVDIPDLRDNKWHNVVVTYAGTGAGAHKTYVDGILKGSLTKNQSSYSSNYYYYVGGGKGDSWASTGANHWFNGNFGDFKYYNRALTDIEVLQNFRAMAPRYGLLYYDILQDDLLFNIDSFYPPSYGGSGTVLTDTVKGLTVDFDGAAATGYGISPYTTPNGWYFSGDATEYVNQNSSDFEFQYGDSFSVEVWTYMNENINTGYIVSNRQTDASGVQYSGWGLLQKDGKIRAAIGGYPSNSFDWRNADISTSDFTNHVYQKWCHIVWSSDGTTSGTKLYINGVDRTDNVSDDATPPYTINYDGDFKLGFGADSFDGTSHPISANISACRIYNKNLSSEEVRRNYNAVANNYGLVPADADAEQLVLTNGRSVTFVGGVESGILVDADSTIYNGWSTGSLLFYDANKDGTWSDDGNGLLWDQVDATTISNWAGYLGTGGGMFKIYETGTKTLIFSYEYSGYRVWVGNSMQYGQFSKDYTGVVPSHNQRVDVYHIPA